MLRSGGRLRLERNDQSSGGAELEKKNLLLLLDSCAQSFFLPPSPVYLLRFRWPLMKDRFGFAEFIAAVKKMHFTKTTCCCEAAPFATQRRPSGLSFMQVEHLEKNKNKTKPGKKKRCCLMSLNRPSCSCRARNQSHAQQQRPALQAQQTGETNECRRLLVRRHPAGHVPVCSHRCVNINRNHIVC